STTAAATATSVAPTATAAVATATSTPTGTLIAASAAPASAGCGSALITATVRDTSGALVPNGTLVAFSTNVGSMATSALTTGGSASTLLSVPAGVAAPEVVTVTSNGVSASIVVPLAGCSAGGGTAPSAAVVPQTTQPSTTAPSA